MGNTLRLSFALKNTYRVNSILYALKQIPMIGRLLPATLYQSRGLKGFAGLLSLLWELISVFLWKYFYFLTLVCGVGLLCRSVPAECAFLQILFLLSLIGSYLNTDFLNPTRAKYYAILLLRMNARSYTLVNYGYTLCKVVIGFLPFTLLFGYSRGVPLWLCILIPFSIAGLKVAVAAESLRDFEKNGYVRNESKLQKYAWLLTGLILALACLPPALGLVLPRKILAALWLLGIPAGLLGVRRILSFPYYREMNQELLSQLFTQIEAAKNATRTAGEKAILADTCVTSQKKGFEFLNELFVKRHRKILWRSALRIAGVFALLGCAVLLLMVFAPGTRPEINQLVLNFLPYFTFILYLINRGTGFTRALFLNCDHSLLTYSFYKRPGFVLKLFQIRLREIMKINAFPALVIGGGLCAILYVSGGTDNPLNYTVLLISILSMSLFFSIHYLTIYYLLQPYTAGTEIKSGTYRIVCMVTYLVCYAMIHVRLPILVFGVACIAFCVGYSILACILVYRFAPRTFRLRM